MTNDTNILYYIKELSLADQDQANYSRTNIAYELTVRMHLICVYGI